MKISFTVIGKVHGKDRPRFTRSGHAYTTPQTAEYERLIQYGYKSAVGLLPPQTGALKLKVTAFMKLPAQIDGERVRQSEKRALIGKPATGKPDGDNILKAVADALNGVAWSDDRQVTSWTVRKRYAPEGAEWLAVEIESDE